MLNRRPAPLVWSPLEYGLHSIFAIPILRDRVEWLLGGHPPGEKPPPWPLLPAAEELTLKLDPSEIVAHLAEQGQLTHGLTSRRGITWTPEAEAVLFHAVHDTSHHMMDVSRLLAPHRLGSGAVRGVGAVGVVEQMNVSDKEVSPSTRSRRPSSAARSGGGPAGQPEASRPAVPSRMPLVGRGDRRVAAAGHPIYPGAAGENLTVSGLDWPDLRPGTILQFEGSPLEVELSWPATPCHHQTQWFTDGDFKRIDHDENPGFSRWYGWVRRPGPVAVGDRLVIPSSP